MILYVDTSSLVKLYVHESGSDEVRRLVNDASTVATSVVAYAEVCASLARQRRAGGLTKRACAQATRLFEQDWPAFLAIGVTPAVSRLAGSLARTHGLRGFDAIHLASFQHLLERSSDDEVHFSCFDERLTKAAKRLR